MKNLLTLSLLSLSINCCYSQGNSLDTTFGNKGAVVTPIKYGSFDEIRSLALQSDGKIIASGVFGSATPGLHTVMVRYNKNGSLDQGFGNNGRIEMQPGNGETLSGLAAIQKLSGVEHIILTERHADPNYNLSLIMGRYKNNGTVDNSFGTAGFVVNNDVIPMKMIVDSSGNILFASAGSSTLTNQFNVYRFLKDGQLDNSFGVNGLASRQDTFAAMPVTIAQQTDGKILAGAIIYNWPPYTVRRMAVTRYKPDGTVDSAFGINGFAHIHTSLNNNAELTGMALQSDGKILVCAIADTGKGYSFYLARLLQNGTTDVSFGNGGEVFTNFGNTQSWALDVLVQADDKIYVAGYASPGGNLSYTFAIARYKANGIIDSTFGVNGRDTTNVGNWSIGLTGAIAPNNNVIMAGYSHYQWPTELTDDFSLLRYLSGLELGIIDLGITGSPVLYPNPVSSVMNISYEIEKEDALTIQLTDMTGRTVQVFKKNERKGAGEYHEVLQLSDSIIPGQYLLQIIGTKGAYSIKLQVAQ